MSNLMLFVTMFSSYSKATKINLRWNIGFILENSTAAFVP